MKLLVGLGNPEGKYIGTRHNVGYDFIDYWQRINNIKAPVMEINKDDIKLPIFYCKIKDSEFFFTKPNTGMNDSGRPIKIAMELCGIKSKELIVIYDDMDFEIGQFKIKVSGGAGRHNGILSIMNNIDNDFTRLRVGIGRPQQNERTLEYVLNKFEDKDVIDNLFKTMVPVVERLIISGTDRAMNIYNRKL